MRSIKIALAAVAVAATTIGGAYAAGVASRSGHDVNDHAAHGQSVAAAARAKHADTQAPSTGDSPTEAPTTPPTTGSTESSDAPDAEPTEAPTETPTSTPAEKGDNGHHYGQTKTHTHVGHHWGRDHGKGPIVKPDNPNKPAKSHPTHPAHPTH